MRAGEVHAQAEPHEQNRAECDPREPTHVREWLGLCGLEGHRCQSLRQMEAPQGTRAGALTLFRTAELA